MALVGSPETPGCMEVAQSSTVREYLKSAHGSSFLSHFGKILNLLLLETLLKVEQFESNSTSALK